MTDLNQFQVGVAWRDISPEQPELLTGPTGMGRLVPIRGVLDPLRMEAMALRAGGELAFVTTSDLRAVEWEWMGEIRQAVARKTGADPMKILFSAVHNHCSSPAPTNHSPQAKAAGQKAIRKIVNAFIDACVEAASNLAPAEIAAATTDVLEPIGQNTPRTALQRHVRQLLGLRARPPARPEIRRKRRARQHADRHPRGPPRRRGAALSPSSPATPATRTCTRCPTSAARPPGPSSGASSSSCPAR